MAAALLAATLSSGCAFSNIDLVQDHRVHILAPAAEQTVHLPVTIRWSVSGLDPGAGNPPVRFAVFVDRAVIKPGTTLRSVASGDHRCLQDPTCPNTTYLREHGVYLVSGTELTLPFLPDLRNSGSHTTRDTHTVTIVILDGDRRDGESAFTRTFFVARGKGE
jgi:hypothetical protein